MICTSPESPVRAPEWPPAPNTLSIVIPALNEEDAIADIVLRIRAAEDGLHQAGIEQVEIVVVDDGSTDRTAEIASVLPGVRVIRHEKNRGYGAAIKTGFARAKGDWLAFLDADGTYPPEELADLCRAAIEQQADVVVGSRRSGGSSAMPPMRRLGNLIWSGLVSMIGSCRCADPASGMRVMRRSALRRLYPLPDGLNFTPVMSTRAVHERLKVLELPICYRERVGRSKLSIVRDGIRFLKTILGTALEYNPAKLLGIAGIALAMVAAFIGMAVLFLRMSGITTLGPLGAFTVFAGLVLSVTGVSIYSLGITFHGLVTLFHARPVRQGLFRDSVLEAAIEPQLGRAGGLSIAIGFALAAIAVIRGGGTWDIARVWLWLLGSALFILVGVQLVISWLVRRVLGKLAGRESMIAHDLQSEAPPKTSGDGAALSLTNLRPDAPGVK